MRRRQHQKRCMSADRQRDHGGRRAVVDPQSRRQPDGDFGPLSVAAQLPDPRLLIPCSPRKKSLFHRVGILLRKSLKT
jgi:hypothetical protein